MEKTRPRPAARPRCEAEGTRFRTGVDVGARRHRPSSCATGTTPSCSPIGATVAARPAGARAASSTASTRRWSTCRRPTGSRSGETVEDQITADGQARRRSSAAATPAPTASAPRTARAPRRSPSWRSCRSPPDERAARPAVADLPDALSEVASRARGGRRARLRRVHRGVPRRRDGHVRGAAARRGRVRRRQRLRRGRGHRAGDPGRAGPARDGLHSARSGRRWSSSSASSSTSAATSRATATT